MPAAFLALLGLEAWIGLVDDVDDTLAAYDLAITMAALERLERAADFHLVFTWSLDKARIEGVENETEALRQPSDRAAPRWSRGFYGVTPDLSTRFDEERRVFPATERISVVFAL